MDPLPQGRRDEVAELQAHRHYTVRSPPNSLNHPAKYYNSKNNKLLALTWDGETPGEGISSETLATATNRTVVDHLAPSVEAARTRARVDALLIYAGSVLRTF